MLAGFIAKHSENSAIVDATPDSAAQRNEPGRFMKLESADGGLSSGSQEFPNGADTLRKIADRVSRHGREIAAAVRRNAIKIFY